MTTHTQQHQSERALLRLEDTYARAVPSLSVAWQGAPAPDPAVVVVNDRLARELGIDPDVLRTPAGVRMLTGVVPQGVPTTAQAYAGHQFGSYSPRLGDGRALLLGELVDPGGRRVDLHLKGSGRTPFSRGGDGYATLGPMLREHLMGEAMHALGVPTTRALAVITTGATVRRERVLPGAILCRVAASHLRVGTMQYAAAHRDLDLLRDVADYAIARHHPSAAQAENPCLELLRQVCLSQADLVARWMQVGLVHGVMNTDNTTLSGETIDYGPCAMLDTYDPRAVFSSIDHGGRYAYGSQPGIASWNLARLAEALLPLIDDDTDAAVEQATAVLQEVPERYNAQAAAGMAHKMGLLEPDASVISGGLELMRRQQVDFTLFFRRLAAGTARELFDEPAAFDAWAARRQGLLAQDPAEVARQMDQVNPLYIPRNHHVEEALQAAEAGDLRPYERLLDAVTDPFTARRELADLAGPPTGGAPHVTYCGT